MIDLANSTVMIIDDTPLNIRVLHEILENNDYKIMAFADGEMAINAINQFPPDLILLDIMMPNMSGYDVCERLKNQNSTAEIPIIFISALDSSDDKVKALELGGVDYISKPFDPEEVLARVRTHLKLYKLQEYLKKYNQQLEHEVQNKVNEKIQLIEGSTLALAKLTESRDFETGQHIVRVQRFCKILSKLLKEKTKYKEVINDEFINNIYYASALHDIGKVGIPDSILLKAGKLLKEEFDIVKEHVIKGAETLEEIIKLYPENKIMKFGILIARYHHEKWNGEGYMEGLKGEMIPLEARIMAIVDVYDALRSIRPYKHARTHEESCEIIRESAGTHFDPTIAEVFLQNHEKFEELFALYQD